MMWKNAMLTPVLVVASAMFLLSACGTTPASPNPTTPEPEANIEVIPMADEETFAYVADQAADGEEFYSGGERVIIGEGSLMVLLGGSSSCPPEIESVSISDTEMIVEVKAMQADRACTADYAWHGFYGDIDATVTVEKATKVVEGQQKTPLEMVHSKN